MRDLSQKQYAARLARLGFKPQGFMGYVELPIPGHRISVSVWNAGPRRRDQLAYLMRELSRHEKKIARERDRIGRPLFSWPLEEASK